MPELEATQARIEPAADQAREPSPPRGWLGALCLVCATGVLSMPALAFADLTVKLTVTDAKGKTLDEQTVAVRANRVRVDNGSGAFVADLDHGVVRFLDRAGGVTELRVAEHNQRLDQTEAAIRRATGRGWADQAQGLSPFAATVTTQRRQIAGFDTVRVDLSRDGKPFLEAWCAPALSTRELLAVARTLGRGPLTPAWGQAALETLWTTGYPLSVRDVETGATALAVSVSSSPIPEAYFTAPVVGKRAGGAPVAPGVGDMPEAQDAAEEQDAAEVEP